MRALWTISLLASVLACTSTRQETDMVAAGAIEVPETEPVTGRVASSIRTSAHAVAVLHDVNQAQIAAAQLAGQRALSREVRDYAQRIIVDHSQIDEQMLELASFAGIRPARPDTPLEELHRSELAGLRETTGAVFDRRYIEQQINAHQRALALVNAAFRQAENDQLRTMLATIVRPRLQAHLELAERLAVEVGASR